GGCLAVWLGASDEHTRQRSVRSEQRRQTAKQPQPCGAGRRLAICFVARRSQPTGGDAPSSRLASGQAALPPKSEVIFEQTLRAEKLFPRTADRWSGSGHGLGGLAGGRFDAVLLQDRGQIRVI